MMPRSSPGNVDLEVYFRRLKSATINQFLLTDQPQTILVLKSPLQIEFQFLFVLKTW